MIRCIRKGWAAALVAAIYALIFAQTVALAASPSGAATLKQPPLQNVPPLAIVMSRGMIPAVGNNVVGGTYDRSEGRTRHRVGRYPVTGVRPFFVGGAIAPAHGGWVCNPQAVTMPWAMEAANSAYKQGDTATVPPCGSYVPTTGVVPSDLGIGTFGAGATIMSRVEISGLSSGQTAYGGQAATVTTTGSKEGFYESLGQTSQVPAIGDLSTTSRTGLVYGISPQAILGRWVAQRDLSMLLVGDSAVWGAGEGSAANQLGEGFTGGGYFARGAYSVPSTQTGKTAPWAKVALGGDAIVAANAPTARLIIAQYLPYATDLITNYLYNDYFGAARTKEQILSDLIDYGRFVNSYGVRFHWTTSLPATTSGASITSLSASGTTATAVMSDVTGLAVGQAFIVSGASPSGYNGTSTISAVAGNSVSFTVSTSGLAVATIPGYAGDNYASVGLQVLNPGYEAAVAYVVEGMREAFASGRLIGGVIDTRSAWQDAANPGKWKTNGTANYYCYTDGVHPTAAAHAAAGAVIGDYLATLRIPGNQSALDLWRPDPAKVREQLEKLERAAGGRVLEPA